MKGEVGRRPYGRGVVEKMGKLHNSTVEFPYFFTTTPRAETFGYQSKIHTDLPAFYGKS